MAAPLANREPRNLEPPQMTGHPTLERTPIREALIDFRVNLGTGSVLEALEALAHSLREDFPTQDLIHQFHGQIRFDPDGVVAEQPQGGLHGHRLVSADGLDVAQVRYDGFTFSRLAPYESWVQMLDHAWPVWERYVSGLRPMGVSRIATRFINCIEVPPHGRLDKVLTAPPQVPAGWPSACSAFLFRYVLKATDDITANVSFATEAGANHEFASLLLDIDCYKLSDFPTSGEAIKETLEKLRKIKNDVFFESLTSETLESYK